MNTTSSMNLYQVSLVLLFCSFFNTFISAINNPTHFTGDISVNCGSHGTSAARNNKNWFGDVRPKFSSLLQVKGSSTTSSVIHKLTSDDDPDPYKTARLSRSRFSYTFRVNPGQKTLRLHFNPAPYRGFNSFKDLFAVEAGPFTLLSNFSASLAADALGVKSFVKEYCINIKENQELDIIFTPTSSQSLDTYAFINGIEIISVSACLSYFHRGDIGIQEVGKSLVYVDNSTALEIIHHLNTKQDSFSSADDGGDMFGMWETVPERKASKINSITWKITVDVGFRYLIRLHFSKGGFKLAEIGGILFKVYINEMIAGSSTDMVGETSDENKFPLYRDYMVMMPGSKQDGKRDLFIRLKSNGELLDGQRPLKGFEIMKLSNPDSSLASPNPLPKAQDSSYRTIRDLIQVLGHRNAIANVAIAMLALVNIYIYVLRQIWEASGAEEENKPSARAEQLCRRFSLDEIQLATSNFSDAHLIGNGGFGRVYKGLVDNGRKTVAIKRLKPDSKQGAREFLTEIETLTELRHDNLVALIGYCNQHEEMILVYEYISCGTLADHIYKFGGNRDSVPSLTWKQRLNICIGAGRGLHYLHTGHLVHRDIKASNILLDENFTAKVSDFGLAKYLSKLESHVSTKVKGTFGYLDPSYFTTGKLTRESDTYSFGVVLLVVLSGKRAADPIAAEDERIVPKWALESVTKGKADQIVASNLRGGISEDSLKTFVGVVERCLHDEPKKRPTMAQVVVELELALEQQESSESPVPDVLVYDSDDDVHPSKVDSLLLADQAVEFLLEKLKRLLLYHANLLGGGWARVVILEKDLRLLKSFLRDSTKKRRKDEGLRELGPQIRDVVYEAEDVIDTFVTQAAESKSKNYFARAFFWPKKLLSIAKEVEKVSCKILEIYGDESKFDFSTHDLKDGGQEESEATPVTPKNVVGFEDEAEKLKGYLREETEQLDVVSVIGMPGLGKTTLAGKIFLDPEIRYEFPIRIWVYISQEFTEKNVFLSILREFTMLSDDMYHKSEGELAKQIRYYLQRGNFLIVMDDVWTAEDWDRLEVALPMNNKSGKVLITSRQEDVARHANRHRPPHKLRFLTLDESWLLLQLEVFGEPKCPPELEGYGQVICGQCDGLPLAIVVIGGILAKKVSTSNENTSIGNAWKKVSESVSPSLNEDPGGRMEKIVALSYDKLPYHLRPCFLYFGMFPEHFEIPVWKLICMWIAEGFIQQKSGVSLEETAETYLEDLIKRNLIMVGQMSPNGRVKTCRICNMLRDFCKTEAVSERNNFLQEMYSSKDGGFYPPVRYVEKYRRLCIHSNVLNFLCSKPYGPHIRSFACFSKEEIDLPSESTSSIPAAFKLIRVLDVEPIKFTKIPAELYHLVHLRYLVLSINLGVLPAAFSKLFNIQTLIVDTTSRTLDIKADISKMIQLRHLKTNASATLTKADKSSKEGEELQTLDMISPQSCTDDVLDRAHNLKKLGIRGNLALLLEGKSGSFDSLGKLEHLEKLKLLNDAFPWPASDGKLRSLPAPYKFPPKLRILSLSHTYLDWSHMSVLGLLENLEVLKLKKQAFMGEHWETEAGGFRHLEVLHIGRTNLVAWTASGHHFPRLRRLELQNCKALQDIPIGLADIPNLQVVDLLYTRLAAASARRIEAKKKQLEDPNTKVTQFKLFIFPPDE